MRAASAVGPPPVRHATARPHGGSSRRSVLDGTGAARPRARSSAAVTRASDSANGRETSSADVEPLSSTAVRSSIVASMIRPFSYSRSRVGRVSRTAPSSSTVDAQRGAVEEVDQERPGRAGRRRTPAPCRRRDSTGSRRVRRPTARPASRPGQGAGAIGCSAVRVPVTGVRAPDPWPRPGRAGARGTAASSCLATGAAGRTSRAVAARPRRTPGSPDRGVTGCRWRSATEGTAVGSASCPWTAHPYPSQRPNRTKRYSQ